MSYARGMGLPSRSIPGQQECSAAEGSALRRACLEYNAGVTLFEQGSFADALVRFTAAHAADLNDTVLVSMGVATFKLGRFEEAVSLWQRYLTSPTGRAGSSGSRRSVVRGYIANALRLMNPTSQVFRDASAKEAEEARVAGPPATTAPMVPPPNPYARRATIGVWVATGVGVLGLAALGYYLVRRAG